MRHRGYLPYPPLCLSCLRILLLILCWMLVKIKWKVPMARVRVAIRSLYRDLGQSTLLVLQATSYATTPSSPSNASNRQRRQPTAPRRTRIGRVKQRPVAPMDAHQGVRRAKANDRYQPIGHHPELRRAVEALTSSWVAHEPPIDGLDPSIVIQSRRLYLTLGVMTLAPAPSAGMPEPE